MEKYEALELEVISFVIEDVVTTSCIEYDTGEGIGCGDDF